MSIRVEGILVKEKSGATVLEGLAGVYVGRHR